MVYETPGEPLKLAGTVSVEGPKLLVRAAGTDAERLVPQADLEWKLYLPSGYVLRRSGGTVTGPLVAKEPPAAVKVATLLYEWADGFRLRDLWGGAQLGYTAPAPTSAFDDGYGYRTDKSEAGAATEMPTSGSEMGGQSLQWRSARDEAKSVDALARPMSSEPLAEATPPAEAPANEPSAPLAVPPESPVPPPPAPALPSDLEINIPPAGISVPQQGASNPPGEESGDRPGRSAGRLRRSRASVR